MIPVFFYFFAHAGRFLFTEHYDVYPYQDAIPTQIMYGTQTHEPTNKYKSEQPPTIGDTVWVNHPEGGGVWVVLQTIEA